MNVIITNAPDAYDYRWAQRSAAFQYELRPGYSVEAWRVSIIEKSDAVYQQGRYLSGNYIAVMEGKD